MITNMTNPEVAPMVQRAEGDSRISAFLAHVKEHAEPFDIVPCDEGFDVHCANTVKGVPNRAHIKLFYPDEKTLVVFFYKHSNVPWSRDRFAYGGIEVKEDALSKDAVQSWLTFAATSFSPEHRPANLLRLFPYDIPR